MPRRYRDEPDDDNLHICGSCGHKLNRGSITDRNTRANSRGHHEPLHSSTYSTWKPGVQSYSANDLDGADEYDPPPGPPPSARAAGDPGRQNGPQRRSAGPTGNQPLHPNPAQYFNQAFPPPPTGQPSTASTTRTGMTNTPPLSTTPSRSPSPEPRRTSYYRPVYPPSNPATPRGSPSSSSSERHHRHQHHHHHHRHHDDRKNQERHVRFPSLPLPKVEVGKINAPVMMVPNKRVYEDPSDAPIESAHIAASVAGIIGGGILGRQLGRGDPMATAIGACLGVFVGTFAEHVSKNKLKYKKRFGRLKEGKD